MVDPEKALAQDTQTLARIALRRGVSIRLDGDEIAFPLDLLHDFYPTNP
jgi:hypothetical protein